VVLQKERLLFCAAPLAVEGLLHVSLKFISIHYHGEGGRKGASEEGSLYLDKPCQQKEQLARKY